MIRYVLFDLDGTLLSTLDTIRYHLNRALVSRNLSEITIDECSEFIGNGARKLVKRAVGKSGSCDEELISEVLRNYNLAYDNDPLPHTYPYEGIRELVDELSARGVTIGVVTNKPEPTAKKLIEYFFPGKFSFVSGGREGIALKPDPKETLRLIDSLDGKSQECVFIGDTDVDILTGKNIGAALSIGVSWGFRTRESLILAGADAVVDKPMDAIGIIFGEV